VFLHIGKLHLSNLHPNSSDTDTRGERGSDHLAIGEKDSNESSVPDIVSPLSSRR